MTAAQKRLRELRERQSRERQRMAELAREENLTDETRAELDKLESGVPDLERQLRAAQVAVDDEETEQRAAGAEARKPEGDAEHRERLELRSKITLGRYLAAAVENRAADGAEAEYLAAYEIPGMGSQLGGTAFPLDLLAPPEPPVEHRAATAVDTQTMPRRWLDRLFAGTAAMRVGVTMESVPTGVSSYPATTAGASAAQRAKSQAVADAAWTIGVTELKPTRNAVRLTFNLGRRGPHSRSGVVAHARSSEGASRGRRPRNLHRRCRRDRERRRHYRLSDRRDYRNGNHAGEQDQGAGNPVGVHWPCGRGFTRAGLAI